MTDLLADITRAKTGLLWLARIAGWQSKTVEMYLGEAVTKLEAARQQLMIEAKQKAAQKE